MKQCRMFVLCSLVGLLVGCSNHAMFSAVSGGSTSSSATAASSTPSLSCLATTPNFILNSSVDSFALTSSSSASAGFSLSGILSAIGLNVSYSSGELDMSMKMYAPLYSTVQVASSTGSATSSNFSFSASAAASLLTGSLGVWKSTGLYDLSENAIVSTYTNLQKNMPAATWSTVITDNLGNDEYLLPVGSTAGLLVGDTFTVYKASYLWSSGTPCAGVLNIVNKLSVLGTATVTQLSYTGAIVSIPNPTAPISDYDRLEIKKLVNSSSGATRSSLKFSVRIGSVTQASGLTFSNGTTTQTVDMTSYVSTQINDYMVNDVSAYYIQ